MSLVKTRSSIHTRENFPYAQVVFPLPIQEEFTYRIPDELLDRCTPGSIISAPFRKGIKTGFITRMDAVKPSFDVKNIQDVLFDIPVFNEEMIDLARWMRDYYFSSLGDILRVMLPVKLDRETVEIITPVFRSKLTDSRNNENMNELEEKLLEIIIKRKKITPKALRREVGRRYLYYSLDKLKRRGKISIDQVLSTKYIKPQKQLFYRPSLTLSSKKQETVFAGAPAQKEVYRYIIAHNPIARSYLLRHFPGRERVVSSLNNKGLIEEFEREVIREYLADVSSGYGTLPPLTHDQQLVVEAINKKPLRKKFSAILLHGVTGSGKTRVYFELIHRALNKERGVLFLVPEIALTNYFLSSLRAQFGECVSVLHSRMSPGERYDSWRAVLSGKKQLVIGPRSAVFAPVKNLGLIIVDEEHDASYKQHESPPYYHARDVAVYRGRITHAHVILGSATPSMESYYNAQTGKYDLLELTERIDRTPMPTVKVIDLRSKNGGNDKKRIPIHPRKGWLTPLDRTYNSPARTYPVFSNELYSALEERLKKDEQVLLMLNRRGYSTFIQCRNCGYIESCRNCKITLTYHKRTQKVTCHFCGFSAKAPLICPDCNGSNIRYSGIGTQQVEEELTKEFPGYRAIRMDLDTTRSKSAHRRITDLFERGESDILVGTQMIAKGFDFARVNLVGVISADTGLLLPEFRAAERTFQLLTQAAGRAGRRKERGLVLIQTHFPEHFSLKAAQNHDFHLFFKKESTHRKELNYPPFGRIILLKFSGMDEKKVAGAAGEIGRLLRGSRYRKYLLGPAPAPIEKIRNRFRWQIFLKIGKSEDPNGKKIRAAASAARNQFDRLPLKNYVGMTIDADPVNLM